MRPRGEQSTEDSHSTRGGSLLAVLNDFRNWLIRQTVSIALFRSSYLRGQRQRFAIVNPRVSGNRLTGCPEVYMRLVVALILVRLDGIEFHDASREASRFGPVACCLGLLRLSCEVQDGRRFGLCAGPY